MTSSLVAPTWASTLATFTRTLGEARAREVLGAAAAALGLGATDDVATLERIATHLAESDDVASMLGLALQIRCKTYLAVCARRQAAQLQHPNLQRTEVDRLAAIKSLDLANERTRALLDEVARRAADALGLPIGLVSIVLDDAQWFAGAAGLGDWIAMTRGTPVEWSFCAHVARDRAPLAVGDATSDPRFSTNPLVVTDGIRAYAGVPLTTSDGHVLGSLCAIGAESRTITGEQLDALRELADQTIRELEARRDG